MAHAARIAHQRVQWEKLKEQRTDQDLLMEIDWSENYECKFGSEIQSVHFGGSHQQISLHTGIAYSGNITQTFCTLSKSTRHDPLAIFAHLKPIIRKFITASTERLHIMSDGPTTQYRSKMFHIVGKYLSKEFPQLKSITWNFSEAGHGKGIPDGVGGTLKRTADSAVAHGSDINTLEKLMELLSDRCSTIFLHVVPEDDITVVETEIQIPVALEAFEGTMKVHQYIWSSMTPTELNFRTLSCYECPAPCNHYSLGKPWKISPAGEKSTGSKKKGKGVSAKQKATKPKHKAPKKQAAAPKKQPVAPKKQGAAPKKQAAPKKVTKASKKKGK